jgi:hypothetical protein
MSDRQLAKAMGMIPREARPQDRAYQEHSDGVLRATMLLAMDKSNATPQELARKWRIPLEYVIEAIEFKAAQERRKIERYTAVAESFKASIEQLVIGRDLALQAAGTKLIWDREELAALTSAPTYSSETQEVATSVVDHIGLAWQGAHQAAGIIEHDSNTCASAFVAYASSLELFLADYAEGKDEDALRDTYEAVSVAIDEVHRVLTEYAWGSQPNPV